MLIKVAETTFQNFPNPVQPELTKFAPTSHRITMATYIRFSLYISVLALIMLGCQQADQQKQQQAEKTVATTIVVPRPSADSAFVFVKHQTDFGPRVPGSAAHEACANWLEQKLDGFADTVYVQLFKTRVYNGTVFEGKNIIGVFNPKAAKRIVLAAHWDSRPYADHDEDVTKHRTPIDGANDGASGVGVLLEVARLLRNHPIDQNLGIDIVLFDLEDYGPHTDERDRYDEDTWALGSQYWSKTPHIAGYQARFGILLDMVGAANPEFPREYFSQQYASWVLDKVWRKAFDLGYGAFFVNKPGSPISDDHLPMNQQAGIPTIDIIHLDPNSVNGTFFDGWHTAGDNISVIDPESLRMVADVVVNVVYNEQ